MGLLSVLQSAVRGTKQIPPFMNAATHEPDQEFVYDQIPPMPYSGQVTPDGPVHDMDFGGGSSAQPVAVKQHVSNRTNGLGKFLQKVPGILNAGIAAGATPNIAGGGMTDVFRAANSGVHTLQAHQDKERELARQKEQDSFRREVQKAQIDTIQAQAAQRRAKAAEGAELPEAKAIGKFGWYDRFGKWNAAPVEPDAKANEVKRNQDIRIGTRGGYELPEKKTFDVPTGSPVPGQGTMQSTVSNVPPPEGYNNLPGTSGDHRIVMPSAETVGDIRHPIQDKPTVADLTTQRAEAADKQGLTGRNREYFIANGRIPTGNPRATTPRKTMQEMVAERTAAADQQGLQGEQRTQFIANGRIATGGGRKPFNAAQAAADIAAALGGNTRPSVPAATPPTQSSGGQKVIAMPPEKAAKLIAGQQQTINGPDGKLWLVVKGQDGLVRRLR